MTNEQDNRQWINPILFKTAQLNKKNWETENREGQLKPLCTVYMRVIYQNIWGNVPDMRRITVLEMFLFSPLC